MDDALTFGALVLGAVLIWAGVKGKSVGEVLIGRFGGSAGPSDLPTTTRSPSRAATISPEQRDAAAAGGGGAGGLSPCCGGPKPELIAFGYGGHRLQPAAARSFQSISAAKGRVLMTDSHRSCAIQQAAYDSDPKRFASPCASKHPYGLAVDIFNLPNGFGDALREAGWRQTRNDEAWHWEYHA